MQAGADSRFGDGAAACHERPSAVTVPRLPPTSGMVEATHQPPSDSNGSRAVRGIRRWPVPWDRL